MVFGYAFACVGAIVAGCDGVGAIGCGLGFDCGVFSRGVTCIMAVNGGSPSSSMWLLATEHASSKVLFNCLMSIVPSSGVRRGCARTNELYAVMTLCTRRPCAWVGVRPRRPRD